MQTCLTIPIGAGRRDGEKSIRRSGAGLPIIKIKLGTKAKEDIDRVRKIRQAVGPQTVIRIDANQGWDVPTALAVLNAFTSLESNIASNRSPIGISPR